MKYLGTITILGVVLAASAPLACANSIQLGSYATNQNNQNNANSAMNYYGNDLTGNTPPTSLGPITKVGTGTNSSFALSPEGLWAGPVTNSTWVGIAANVGPGPAGTVNPNYGYYEFTTTFDATAGTYNGSLNVLADDTVEVLLNNNIIIPFGALGGDGMCADKAPGCQLSTETSLLLNDITLDASNTLEFIVEQAGNQTGPGGTDPSGVDFDATLTQTPEPGTLFLLGTGLLSAAGIARRKFTAKFNA
jgi:PEP-CTERM motif